MAIHVFLAPSKLLRENIDFSLKVEGSKLPLMKNSMKLVEELKEHDVNFWVNKLAVKKDVAERSQLWLSEISEKQLLKRGIPAALMFQGEAFKYLNAESFSTADWKWAQNHLSILSGMYGIARATDLILPYRLMIGSSIPTLHHGNLYQFWKDHIANYINRELKEKLLINCASEEYSKVLDRKKIEATIIDVSFLQKKDSEYKNVATLSKQARGALAGFAIRNKLKTVEELSKFKDSGYSFAKKMSTDNKLVFIR
jgi:uncharacterized protein